MSATLAEMRHSVGKFLYSYFGFQQHHHFYIKSRPNELFMKLSRTKALFSVQQGSSPNQLRLVLNRLHHGQKESQPYLEAGVQLLEDLSLQGAGERCIVELEPHNVLERWLTQRFEPEAQFWLVKPARDALVSLPTMFFLRDLFEEVGITACLKIGVTGRDNQTIVQARTIPDPFPKVEDNWQIEQLPLELQSLLKSRERLNFLDAVRQFNVNSSGNRRFKVATPDFKAKPRFRDDPHFFASKFARDCVKRQSTCGHMHSHMNKQGGFKFSPERSPTFNLRQAFGYTGIHWYSAVIYGDRDYMAGESVEFWNMLALREAMHWWGLATETVDNSGFFPQYPKPVTFAGLNPARLRAQDLHRQFSFYYQEEFTAWLLRHRYAGVRATTAAPDSKPLATLAEIAALPHGDATSPDTPPAIEFVPVANNLTATHA